MTVCPVTEYHRAALQEVGTLHCAREHYSISILLSNSYARQVKGETTLVPVNPESRLNLALALLRNQYEKLFDGSSPLQVLEATIPPAEGEDLWLNLVQLRSYERRVRQAVDDLLLRSETPIAQAAPGLWRFYRHTFVPNRRILDALESTAWDANGAPLRLSDADGELLLREAIEQSSQAIDSDHRADDSDTSGYGTAENDESERWFDLDPNEVKAVFEIGLNLVDMKEDIWDDWEVSEDAVKLALTLGEATWFRPDEWTRNLRALQPVSTGRAPGSHPMHIRIRLREVYDSFLLGNFLAAVSLSRSTMEYALIDRATHFAVELDFDTGDRGRRELPLHAIVDGYSRRLPQLATAMETLRELGNHVMHPRKRKAYATLPISRTHALRAVRALSEILEEIYTPAAMTTSTN